MSINSTLTSVNTSSASNVSKSSNADTKKTTDTSFKDEMDKVTSSKQQPQEATAVNDTKEVVDVKDVATSDKTVGQTNTDTKQPQQGVEAKPENGVIIDKSDKTGVKDTTVSHQDKQSVLTNLEKNNIEFIKNQQFFEQKNLLGQEVVQQTEVLTAEQQISNNLVFENATNKKHEILNAEQQDIITSTVVDNNVNKKHDILNAEQQDIITSTVVDNNVNKKHEILNAEQQIEQTANIVTSNKVSDKKSEVVSHDKQINKVGADATTKEVNNNKKEGHIVKTEEVDKSLQLNEISQVEEVDNNLNVDSFKVEETDMVAGNILINNAISNFDINNNELTNDIQQMIQTSNAPKVAAVKATEAIVGSMDINSSRNISMTQADAEFFVNLTQSNDVSVQNIVAQATEMVQQGVEVKEVQQNVKVSQALLDALTESREKSQPVRIDFDKDVSVILRVNRDGSLAANFIPGDKAVEQYLRNNIESLRNTFNENDLPYSDLNYSSRGNKQQKENQRDRQQQQHQQQ